jgi:hypothetical protein
MVLCQNYRKKSHGHNENHILELWKKHLELLRILSVIMLKPHEQSISLNSVEDGGTWFLDLKKRGRVGISDIAL